MKSEYIKKDRLLLFEITEEIDHHTTEKIKRRADYEIERFMPRKVVFDFSSVTFMDSAGIGMVIGRYKMAKMFGGTIELKNVNASVKRILDMCGVSRLIPIINDKKEQIMVGKSN